MLNKLLKHELKATSRFFLPAYGVFAALLIVERLSMMLTISQAQKNGPFGQFAAIITMLLTILTVVGLLILLVAPVFYGIARFYRNLLGDEGYLSFTLPVKTSSHIWSKLLVYCLWVVVTALVVILCGVLFFLTVDGGEVRNFFSAVGEFFSQLYLGAGAWAVVLPLMMVLAMLCQLGTGALTLYSSMSIGQMASKHRFLTSAGMYMAFQFGTAMILQFLGAIVVSSRLGDTLYRVYFRDVPLHGELNQLCGFVATILAGTIVLNLLLATLHFFLTRHFLTKNLNLA